MLYMYFNVNLNIMIYIKHSHPNKGIVFVNSSIGYTIDFPCQTSSL